MIGSDAPVPAALRFVPGAIDRGAGRV